MFFSEKLNAVMTHIGVGGTQVCVVNGKVSDKEEIMVITFKPLQNAQEIGTEVTDDDSSTEKGIGLVIHNIDGLEVLEKALAVCREKLTPDDIDTK